MSKLFFLSILNIIGIDNVNLKYVYTIFCLRFAYIAVM